MEDFNYDHDNQLYDEHEETIGTGSLDYNEEDLDGDGRTDLIWREDDVDGNGVADHGEAYVDTDGDGIFDQMIEYRDANEDGNPEELTIAVDTDANGVFDAAVIAIDSNSDGNVDVQANAIDANQDGTFESMRVYESTAQDGNFDKMTEMYDANGDGTIDTAKQYYDYDLDGKADYVQNCTYNPQTGEVTPVEAPPSYGAPAAVVPQFHDQYKPDDSYPDGIVGDPASSMEHWECQGETNRCALFSQMFVIEELTGEEIDMYEFQQIAEENGWYDDGTSLVNLNRMLDYYGIENEMSFHNDISDVEECLNNGGRVIVAVDADEIWYYGQGDDLFSPNSSANHAVEVIGIDYSDPDNPMVILNDSGTPYGCGEMVPLDEFMDAWQDSECQMVVCYPGN